MVITWLSYLFCSWIPLCKITNAICQTKSQMPSAKHLRFPTFEAEAHLRPMRRGNCACVAQLEPHKAIQIDAHERNGTPYLTLSESQCNKNIIGQECMPVCVGSQPRNKRPTLHLIDSKCGQKMNASTKSVNQNDMYFCTLLILNILNATNTESRLLATWPQFKVPLIENLCCGRSGSHQDCKLLTTWLQFKMSARS